MKEVIVRSWCDLAYSRGEQVEASDTQYTLAFNGVAVDLDLSDIGAKEIMETLAPFFAIGRRKSQFERPGRRALSGPGSKADMRAFADANGYKYSHNKGGFSYPKPLREAYAQHLAEIAGK